LKNIHKEGLILWKKIGSILLGIILILTTGCGNLEPTKANDEPVNGNEKIITTIDVQNADGTQVVLALENNTKKVVRLTFMSGKQYEINVYDKNNELVYNSSKDKMYTQAINHITLEPGEREEWADLVQQKLEPGEYKIVAKITASEISPNTIQLNELEVEKTVKIK
jgi:hypothetical protein